MPLPTQLYRVVTNQVQKINTILVQQHTHPMRPEKWLDTCDSYSMALVRPQARDSRRNPASAGGWVRLRILPLMITGVTHTCCHVTG